MSHYDYEVAVKLYRDDVPFYALVMAAMLKGDSNNIERLKGAFPEVHAELYERYHAPGGRLGSDHVGDAAAR